MAVVAFHSELPLFGGFLGVDIFFAISGYVITGVLLRSAGSISSTLRSFYIRRFRRLVPAYSVLIFFTLAMSVLFFSPFEAQKNTAQTAIGASFGLANLVISKTTGGYFDLAASSNPLLHTWSLAVEEQFYLLFPLFVLAAIWFCRRKLSKNSSSMIIIVVITAVSMALMFIGDSESFVKIPSIAKGFYSPFPRIWEFGFGAAAFILSSRFLQLPNWIRTTLALCGSLLLIYSFASINESTPTPGPLTIIPVLGVALIMWAGSGQRPGLVNRSLGSKPLVFIGNISYSLYLWHWPFIVFAAVIWPDIPLAIWLATLLSFIPAILSYFLLEQKLTGPWNFKANKKIGVAGSFLLIPVIFALLILFANTHNYWIASIGEIKQQIAESHIGDKSGCVSLNVPSGEWDAKCVFGATNSGTTPIYLVGDSHADQFAEGVVEAGKALGLPVKLNTTNGCPFIPLFVKREELGPQWQLQCYQNAIGKLNWLEGQQPGIVIISNANYFSAWRLSESPNSPTVDVSENLGLYREALSQEISTLQAAGHKVVVVGPTPNNLQNIFWPQNCTTTSILSSWCKSDTSLQIATQTIRGFVRVTKQVTEETDSTYIDLNSYLCPENTCTTVTNGRVNFRNADHITVGLSRTLGWIFIQNLAPLK